MKHPKKYDTTPEISKRMSKIKAKRTKPEIVLSKALFKKGFRYRLNYKELPGTPDIAIIKYRIAIFVDGEFWHGKHFEFNQNVSHTNNEYWNEKIYENILRDARNNNELIKLGWVPIHFWSNDALKNTNICVSEIEALIEEKHNENNEL